MATGEHMTELARKQALTDLQIRGLQAKAAFLDMNIEVFMPHIEAQAETEKTLFRPEDKPRIRQVLNGNVQPVDLPLLELAERTVEALHKNAA